MSKRLPIQVPSIPAGAPAIWRSLDEKADPRRAAADALEERALQQDGLRSDGALVGLRSLTEKPVGRRKFFALGGAGAAAVGLAGCLRRPAENILPFTAAPEYTLPGIPLHYATSVSHHGEAIGLLVESHEGRPTKIEGNPEHPASLGATDGALQATILDLYDPDRSAHVRRGDTEASWSDFDAWWRGKAATFARTGGRGLAVLAAPTDSPSFIRARSELLARFPNARVHTWTSVSTSATRAGARLAFGSSVTPIVDFARPRVVLAIDSDFLEGEPGAIRSARRFAEGRRLRRPTDELNRLYAVESTLTITGMSADHRLRLAPSQIDGYLRVLAAKLATLPGIALAPEIAEVVGGAGAIEGVPSAWIDAVAADLAQHTGQSLVTVGHRQPAHVHALAHALNAALGNLGRTTAVFDAVDPDEPDHATSLRELVEAASARSVDTLVILGGNPVYDAPADLDFSAALGNVQNAVHLSGYVDETSAASGWHLPKAHELECWGDHVSVDGTYSVQQPLIAPLRGGRSDTELLASIAGIRAWRGYGVARETLRGARVATEQSIAQTVAEARAAAATEADGGTPVAEPSASPTIAALDPNDFERAWRRSLHTGVAQGGSRIGARRDAAVQGAAIADALRRAPVAERGQWEAVFIASYQTYDGRQANNPWMLELPDPVTKIVWDNAAYVSPASARTLGVSTGDGIAIHNGDKAITLPVFVLPGQPDGVVTLPLGFGRTHAGRFGNGIGFDVHPLRHSTELGFAKSVEVNVAAGARHSIVQTQDHHSMEGRPLAIDATLAQYRETPDFGQWRTPTPDVGPLWTQVDYSAPRPRAQGGKSYEPMPEVEEPRHGAPPRYKWSMGIDLTSCTGCSACVVACQAENNIAVVGKQQVSRGREMHWLRIDRYFVGDDIDDPRVAVQPVACQHCEEAPCENVCPVAATTHSPEGLNDMAYNRCIGTRYCMNNCPYKVRRFNFLDFHGDVPELTRMHFNPNVTVRMRGVVEKCSYCVQRIQYARIQARRATTVRLDDRGAPVMEDGAPVIDERRIGDEEVTPACAQACPSGAIVFGDLNNPESRAHEWAHRDRQYELLGFIGTQPRTKFLGKVRNPNPAMLSDAAAGPTPETR